MNMRVVQAVRDRCVAISLIMVLVIASTPAASAVDIVDTSPLASGWSTEEIARGLEHPWGMDFLPNGDLLVTERPGQLRLVTASGLHPDPIAGLPQIYAQRQGGLLDVAIDPEYEKLRNEQPWIYLTYSAGTRRSNATTLARAQLQDHRLVDFEVLYQVTPGKSNAFHYGSRIGFLPDHSLVFSVGDGYMRDRVPDLGNAFGKILRIRRDGSAATDNPFQARVDAIQEVYSSGHRNIQGLSVHPETGALWVTEHGPRGGDELNLIQPGGDYGWPIFTYGQEYRGGEIGEGMRHGNGTIEPVIVWTPSIATSGLAWYTGSAIPEWQGNLFAGGLIKRQIRRLVIENNHVVHQETLQFNARIRDIANGPDGHLYVATDEVNGRILRIVADN